MCKSANAKYTGSEHTQYFIGKYFVQSECANLYLCTYKNKATHIYIYAHTHTVTTEYNFRKNIMAMATSEKTNKKEHVRIKEWNRWKEREREKGRYEGKKAN